MKLIDSILEIVVMSLFFFIESLFSSAIDDLSLKCIEKDMTISVSLYEGKRAIIDGTDARFTIPNPSIFERL